METITLEIKDRTITGKKVKILRRDGMIPANIYGPGIESHSIQTYTADMEKTLLRAGGTQLVTLKNPSDNERKVLIKRAQRDPLSGRLLHVDFHQVSLKDKIKVSVPLAFEGESRATRRNDLILLENLNAIEVECLPTEIPEKLIIDISGLEEAGDRLLASDLVIDANIVMLTNPEDILISVSQAKAEEVEEAVEGEDAEGVAAEASKSEAASAAEPASE